MPASERETAMAHQIQALQSRLHEIVREERMDVLAVIAKGDNEERAARQRHIEDVARDLRAELRREVMELREDVGELVAAVHEAIRREETSRRMELDTIYNANPTLRTEVV
jgi:hypothetical protein